MSRAGTRLAWDRVPVPIRLAVEAELGCRVVRHENVHGGFTPGPAGPLELADGRRVFAKACGEALSAPATAMHRREAAVLPRLDIDVPAPDFVTAVDLDGWIVLVTELVDGHSPTAPTTPGDVDAVFDLITALVELGERPGWRTVLDPVGTDPAERDARWAWAKVVDDGTADRLPDWPRRHLDRLVQLERGWLEATVGGHLLHRDLRLDNVVTAPDGRAIAVDWAHASLGAAWVDLVGLLPSLELDGGPRPEDVFTEHPVGRAADPDRVDVYLAAIAGYFMRSSLLPPPPGVAGLREFQRAQGDITCRWLASRVGW